MTRSAWRRARTLQPVRETALPRWCASTKKRLHSGGGYTTSNWNTSNPTGNPTIIDANDNGICIYVNYTADIGIGQIVIDGFSITDGSATTTGAGTDSGGGIYIPRTTHVRVTIQNCKIYENYAEDGSGAGIWSTRSDNLNVAYNEIYDNEGSGVVVTYGDNTVIIDNDIDNNEGDGVSIISDLGGGTDIHGNEVTNNQGVGINLNTATGGSISDNVVTNNHNTGGGGGLDITGATNDFTISDNTINGNSATVQGGGINISGSVAEIKDNTIQSNYTTAGSNGGGRTVCECRRQQCLCVGLRQSNLIKYHDKSRWRHACTRECRYNRQHDN